MILVAGGSGFIGSSAVRRLVKEGLDVGVMTAHSRRSGASLHAMGAKAVEGNILDASSLEKAVAGADVVMQALTFPTFPVEKPSRRFTFEEFEGKGTARLVGAAARAGVRKFVYVSGVGAAPEAVEVRFRAKWHGEEAVRSSGIAHVILRPSWAYGPGDRALNRFVLLHRLLPFVPVVGDGNQILQPVFIDDVGEALAQAADLSGPLGTFEIGGPEILTMNEVLETMMAVRGKRKPLLHFPEALPKLAGVFLQYLPKPLLSPDAVSFLTEDAVADTASLLEQFDLKPRTLHEGLETYLR